MNIGKVLPLVNDAVDANKRNSGNTRKTDFPKMRERLEQLRKDSGYTQEQVAKKIKSCVRAYRSWIIGKYDAKTNTLKFTNPSLENLIELANLYNVSIDYITGLSDYTHVENNVISQKTGLSDDSINLLGKFNDKDNQFYNVNKPNIKILNMVLEDYYKELRKTDSAREQKSYTNTLFMYIYEYMQSDNYYRYKEDGNDDDKVFLHNEKLELSRQPRISDLFENYCQNKIIKTLNEIKSRNTDDNETMFQ